MNKGLEELFKANSLYEEVYSLIASEGSAEDPITVTELRIAFGFSDNKARRVIGRLREFGALILSDEDGYWIARNEAEIQEWIRWYLAPCFPDTR